MATSTDCTSTANSTPMTATDGCFRLKNTIDTSDITGDYTGIGADTMQVLDIPAGTFVSTVILNITTAQTAATDTITLDVGDGDDADGWLDGVDAETAAVSLSSTATYTLTEGAPNTLAISPAFGETGKYYSAADTIDVLVVNAGSTDATDDLVFEITAICYPV